MIIPFEYDISKDSINQYILKKNESLYHSSMRYPVNIDKISCKYLSKRNEFFDFAFSLSERYPGSNRWYRIFFVTWSSIHFV